MICFLLKLNNFNRVLCLAKIAFATDEKLHLVQENWSSHALQWLVYVGDKHKKQTEAEHAHSMNLQKSIVLGFCSAKFPVKIKSVCKNWSVINIKFSLDVDFLC